MNHSPPALATFTPAERRLIRRLRTPILVQRFLNQLPYNTEPKPGPETLRSLRQVLRHQTAHCLEAALAAACILEKHGFPPLVMSLKSIDYLDHVIFVYRERDRWGAVARSRDPGLHGRKPVFRSARALAMSYFDPYIDFTGCLTGYAVFDCAGWEPMTGGCPAGTSGRSSELCCATGTSRSKARARASGDTAGGIARTGRNTRKSRCSIAAGKNGRRFRRSSCSAPSYQDSASSGARPKISHPL